VSKWPNIPAKCRKSVRWTHSWYADTTNRSFLYFLLVYEDYFHMAKEYVIGHFTVNLTQFSPFCAYSVIAHRLFQKQKPRTVGLFTKWRWMDNSFTLRPTLSLWTPLIICSFGGEVMTRQIPGGRCSYGNHNLWRCTGSHHLGLQGGGVKASVFQILYVYFTLLHAYWQCREISWIYFCTGPGNILSRPCHHA